MPYHIKGEYLWTCFELYTAWLFVDIDAGVNTKDGSNWNECSWELPPEFMQK